MIAHRCVNMTWDYIDIYITPYPCSTFTTILLQYYSDSLAKYGHRVSQVSWQLSAMPWPTRLDWPLAGGLLALFECLINLANSEESDHYKDEEWVRSKLKMAMISWVISAVHRQKVALQRACRQYVQAVSQVVEVDRAVRKKMRGCRWTSLSILRRHKDQAVQSLKTISVYTKARRSNKHTIYSPNIWSHNLWRCNCWWLCHCQRGVEADAESVMLDEVVLVGVIPQVMVVRRVNWHSTIWTLPSSKNLRFNLKRKF